MTQDILAQARTALEARQLDRALDLVQAAVRADPADPDGLELFATIVQARGDLRSAEQIWAQAIAVAPGRRGGYNALARLFASQGRAAETEAVARDAIAADPENGFAHAMLGIKLSERTMLAPGIWHLRRAIALGERHPELLAALGHDLIREGDLEEAEQALREAVANMPNGILPRAHLALALERQDRFEEARAMLAETAALGAATGQDVTIQEAMLLDRTPDWREGLAMLDAVPVLPGTGTLLRGRMRDKAGRHAEAWRDFVEGKAQLLRETGQSYAREGVEAHIAQLRQVFTPERFAALPRARRRSDVPQPLFILGFPRSGTTMAEQILASHSRIRPGGELPFTGELIEFAVTQIGRFPEGLPSLLAADRHHVVTLFRDFYLARAEQYGLLEPGADWFTDKMPLNDIYMPLVRLAFPESKIVSVRRHPLDVLVSAMSHALTHGFNCGFRLEDAAHHLAAISELTEHWESIGIPFHRLVYEKFLTDQANETQALMAFLGMEVEPAQLKFHESRRFAATPSYAQVREAVHTKSVERWRNYAAELAPAVPVVADAMARDGYTA